MRLPLSVLVLFSLAAGGAGATASEHPPPATPGDDTPNGPRPWEAASITGSSRGKQGYAVPQNPGTKARRRWKKARRTRG